MPASVALPWMVGINGGNSNTPLIQSVEVKPDLQGAGLGYGKELSQAAGMPWTPGWEGLLNFDFNPAPQHQQLSQQQQYQPHHQPTQSHQQSQQKLIDKAEAQSMSRGRSESGKVEDLSGILSPGRIAQAGSDLAWRTILGSVVDVEGVGEVGVARVLQEVWRRGGGDAVSVQAYSPHCKATCR